MLLCLCDRKVSDCVSVLLEVILGGMELDNRELCVCLCVRKYVCVNPSTCLCIHLKKTTIFKLSNFINVYTT